MRGSGRGGVRDGERVMERGRGTGSGGKGEGMHKSDGGELLWISEPFSFLQGHTGHWMVCLMST